MAEIIIDFVLTILQEFILQLLGELGIEFGLRSLKNRKPDRKTSLFVSFFGYIIAAFILGIISLRFIQPLLIKSYLLQILNLILTPILVGFIMARRGKKLIEQEKPVYLINNFWNGYAFALTFALTRFLLQNKF